MLRDQLWRLSVASFSFRAEEFFGRFIFRGEFGLVPLIFGPGIGRDSPRAISFNVEVVDSSDKSKGSSFSPVRAPGVPDNPIFGSIFFSPASDTNIMIFLKSSGFINEDASSIIFEFGSDSDCAGDGSSLEDFVHHVGFSFNQSILFDSVDFSSGLDEATLSWHAVLALDHSRAPNSIIMAKGLIRRAGLVSDVVVVNPLVSVLGITSVTTFVRSLARNEHLRGEVDIRPLGFSHDFDSVTEG